MDKKVKFAVIGCGRISYNHIDGITHAPHADLVAVCDIIEERARETARELIRELESIETELKRDMTAAV